MEKRDADRGPRPLIGTAEAMRISGLSRPTICRMCEAGQVPAAKVANRWLINRAAFMELFTGAGVMA